MLHRRPSLIRRASLAVLAVLTAALAVLALAGGPAYAQSGAQSDAVTQVAANTGSDSFAVHDIKVDVTAASAAAARDQAITEAQRRAFQQLFRRLVVDEKAAAPKIGDADLAQLVQGFEIDEERSSAVRYLATLTVRFKPQAVRSFLLGQGVKYVEIPSKPTLVLPVDETGGTPVLWDDRTPWHDAWEDRAHVGGDLIPVVVPPGDLSDVAAIGVKEALEGAPGPLAAIADRYGTGDVVVARYRPAQGGAQVTVTRFGPGGMSQSDTVQVSAGQEAGDPAGLYKRAVSAVMTGLETNWRRDNVVEGGAESQLSVTVPITRLEDWLETRRRLTMVPTMTRAVVLSVGRSAVELNLSFRGSLDRFRQSLAQRDLTLTQLSPGYPAASLPVGMAAGNPLPPAVAMTGPGLGGVGAGMTPGMAGAAPDLSGLWELRLGGRGAAAPVDAAAPAAGPAALTPTPLAGMAPAGSPAPAR